MQPFNVASSLIKHQIPTNMRSFFLPAAIVITLTVVSCKKSDSTDNTVPRVKTYTEDVTSPSVDNGHVVDSFTLSYDAQDRITSLVSVTNPPEKFVYTYGSNSFKMVITGDDNSVLNVF